ncbi:MAG: GldM family protein [Chitinophagales bacterium]
MQNNQSLRQKMINMLYLVLIGMVFMNPVLDFIELFTDMNKTLERANYRIEQKNNQTLKTLKRVLEADSAKYHGIYSKLEKARMISDTTINFLDSIKNSLIIESGGYRGMHIKSAKDATMSHRKMIKDGVALDIKERLETVKSQLLNLMDESETAMLDTVLITTDTLRKIDGNLMEWEKYYFDEVPLNAVIALLTKFQNDIRLSQSMVIKKYYDITERGFDVSMTTPEAVELDTILLEKGVRKFDVFDIGDDGTARIIIPNIPKQSLGDAMIYQYDDAGNIIDSFAFKNGVGEIELNTSQIGEFKVKGVVKFRYPAPKDPQAKESGKIQDETLTQEYPFEINYDVINPQPHISQKDFNVLYVGVNNPIKVNHPEHNREKYEVTISQGEIIDNGEEFFARVNRTGFAYVTLKIPDKNGAMKTVNTEKFMVKELPKPTAKVYNRVGGDMPSKLFKQQKGLKVELDNLPYDANYRVVEYKITYINSNGLGIFREKVKGSYFTGRAKELVDLAQPGDIFIFEEIFVKGPNGKNEEIESLVFNIK